MTSSLYKHFEYYFFCFIFSPRDNCDDGTSAIETGHIFKEVAEEFLRDHPNDFCGIRMIYAPIRYVMAPQVETYLEIASQLKVELGDFMAGFDLVGQEDKGKPLIDFVPVFLEKLNGSDLKLFFHAGETDWWVSTSFFCLPLSSNSSILELLLWFSQHFEILLNYSFSYHLKIF